MGRDGGERGHARLIRVSLDEFGCPVAEHHDRRVRAATGNYRQDGSVDHPQVFDTADPTPLVDNGFRAAVVAYRCATT